LLAHLRPTLFAYNFMVVARRRASLSELSAATAETETGTVSASLPPEETPSGTA
jgi:hypothetical protein